MTEPDASARSSQRGAALWAALISLPLPGLGHILARRFGLGVALFAVSFAGTLVMRAATWLAAPDPPVLMAWFAFGALGLAYGLACAVHSYRLRLAGAGARPRWFRSAWVAAPVMLGLGTAGELAIGRGWRSFSIPSGSNIPTLMIGDYIFGDMRHPGTMPEPGEMVLFLLPSDGRTEYVKRVVAVAGQHVQMRRGVLFIDGVPVKLERLGEEAQDGDGPSRTVQRLRETLPNGLSHDIHKIGPNRGDDTRDYLVPAAHFFVLGDNRDNSLDSRMPQIGFVPVANLIGRARTIYWSDDRQRILTPVG